jgi:CubicO group peptidase (beta-lactamase class C family)
MKNRVFRLLFFAITIAYLGGTPVAQGRSSSPRAAFDGVRSKIVRLVEERKVPSMSVAVAKDGKIIWEESFGWANIEKKIKATPQTAYSLASISKPITATGLMILVERGLVDLEATVDDYLGQAKLTAYEGKASAATVAQLLHHTSGLPTHWHFFYENEPLRPPAMDETIRRYGILVAPPGEVHQYSNLGYGILDYIISRVSGKSYDKFMKDEVFLPLGLPHTFVSTAPAPEASSAQRYTADLSPVPHYDFDHGGASAVYSSAHDLVRFGMFHLKNHLGDQTRILKDETIDLMQRHTDKHLPGIDYKLGWGVDKDDNGYLSVSHGGGMPGVSTGLKLIPSENLAVVVLCNVRSDLTSEISDEIFASLLPRYAENLQAKKAKGNDRIAPKKPSLESLEGKWTGEIKTFSGVLPVQMTFQKDGDVHIKIKDQMETLLNDIDWDGATLRGQFYGEVKTDDTHVPHIVLLDIRLRGNRMSGHVLAMNDPWFGLASWIQVSR